MTGLTTEVKGVCEGLKRLYVHSIETYKKPPREFRMGLQEYREFLKEAGFRRGEPHVGSQDVYMDVYIFVVPGSGIDFIPPIGFC